MMKRMISKTKGLSPSVCLKQAAYAEPGQQNSAETREDEGEAGDGLEKGIAISMMGVQHFNSAGCPSFAQ